MTTVVRPIPGDGVVAHQGGLLLVCGPAAEDTIEGLLEAVREVAANGGNGRTIARRVARVLAEAMATEPVSCAVAGPADGGIAVLVSGSATAVVTGPGGEVTLTGRDALTWTDRLVGGPVIRVELRLCGPGTPTGQADPRWRLDGGVVPGGGVECLWTEASVPTPLDQATPGPFPVDQWARNAETPAPTDDDRTAQSVPTISDEEFRRLHPSGSGHPSEWPTPHAPSVVRDERQRSANFEEIRSQPFESVLLVPATESDPESATLPQAPAPPPVPDPRPLVWGGDCKNEHFNDPRAPYCGVCGIGMAQRTLIPRQRPRPPLGVLLIDDGMALRLDVDYLFGRDPEHAKEVTSGEARPARLTDQEGSVSRRHLRVALEEWDVRLVDLGSVNGTYVMPPDQETFVQIPPHEPVMIVPGTQVRVGGLRTFRYESHRK
ncbi:MAG: hypothetical protein JWN52_7256 [Actinomycetia bacterium]|nr:hypothetical protein [Actinomycetes bacterium]